MKKYNDEIIKEQDLPEGTPWEKITDRPRSLADLSVRDGKALEDAGAAIGDIEDWQNYLDTILDVQTAEIIAEWTFKASGALAISTDSSNGIWLSPTGILAKKAGATTFALTSSGDATFGGSLIAGVEITSPVITGGLIRTSSSGSRIELRDNSASIWPDSIAVINLSGNDVGRIRGGDAWAVVEGTWLFPSGINLDAQCVWENPFGYRSLEVWEQTLKTRNIVPLGTNSLGSTSARWDWGYFDDVRIYGNLQVGSATDVEATLNTIAGALSSLASLVSAIDSDLAWVEANCCP